MRLNDRDEFGDGDQSPLQIVPADGPGAKLWYFWADGGDFGTICSLRLLPPFMAACIRGDAPAVESLVASARQAGPDQLTALLERRLGLMRMSPLHCAVTAAKFMGTPYAKNLGITPQTAEHSRVIDALLAAGARVGSRDIIGATPLHYCTGVSGTQLTWGKILPALAAAGADVNARNRFGQTALMEPAQCGDVDAFKALIKLEADPHITCHASMSLKVASDQCRDAKKREAVLALIDKATKAAARKTGPTVASPALVGQRVRLQGLVSRPELNGREGIAEQLDEAAGRFVVRILPPGAEGTPADISRDVGEDESERAPIRLKRENVLLVGDASCAACGVTAEDAKLQKCSGCMLVMYCGGECSRCARPHFIVASLRTAVASSAP